ncbi:hypothetical protein [Streptomyces sp. NPDC005970]|uniref:hypothetical protein n=1 Tax=unclassified Streptomyces TaxID=2593676 RepID=UPI0033FC4CA3
MASKDQFNEKARQTKRKAQGEQSQQQRREQPPRESRESRESRGPAMRDREEGVEDQEPFEEM